jgi:hypothetical protein
MAPTPLTATYRLTWNYTSMLLPHVLRCYLDCVASADPSGFDNVPRAGFASTGVSDLVDPMWTILAPFYKPADASFGTTTLEHYVAGSWIPLWGATTAVVPTSANANRAAFGRCIAGKTTGNKHVKAYFYESDLFVAAKIASYAAGSVRDQALIDYFFQVVGVANPDSAYVWRMSRGKEYASRWLALIDDSNEKLRRVRHVK